MTLEVYHQFRITNASIQAWVKALLTKAEIKMSITEVNSGYAVDAPFSWDTPFYLLLETGYGNI